MQHELMHQLPPSLRQRLPRPAQEIYKDAPSDALKQYNLESEAKQTSNLTEVSDQTNHALLQTTHSENELDVWLKLKKRKEAHGKQQR